MAVLDQEEVASVVKSVCMWLEMLPPQARLLSPKDQSIIVVPNAHYAAQVLRVALQPPEGTA